VRFAEPTTSRLASAAIDALVIIGVLSRRRCELPLRFELTPLALLSP
jgi:hypothetical protein